MIFKDYAGMRNRCRPKQWETSYSDFSTRKVTHVSFKVRGILSDNVDGVTRKGGAK